MGVFNIIWGSIPVVVLLSMYFNCRYMIKGDKNILIGVTIPFLELKNEKVLDIVKEFKKENIKGFIIAAILFIPSFFFKLKHFDKAFIVGLIYFLLLVIVLASTTTLYTLSLVASFVPFLSTISPRLNGIVRLLYCC